MRILVACEFSGRVRQAFAALGHDAWSCDLLPSEQEGNHIQGNVVDILGDGWNLMVAHPPCTYLSNSGVRWLYGGKGNVRDERRWLEMEMAAIFFKVLLDAPIPHIAVENPIMHRYGKTIIGQSYSQTIQPYQFGEGETKATCLWLKNLPPLEPTQIVTGREARVHKEPPSPERWKNRSRTFQGIADAMAQQWGNYLTRCDSTYFLSISSGAPPTVAA